MPIIPLTLALLLFATPAMGAGDPLLGDYLPGDVTYSGSVPQPSSVLGWEVGTWHVRHDLLVAYMRELAEQSDRVRIEVTGKTHEDRPLLLLTISSPRNLARLDEIRREHLLLSDPSVDKPDTTSMPVVVYLGYSIHGNEASGSNAALLVAYHLAAARGEEMDRLLDNTVILLDPSLNPDGLSRFAQWANMHRGRVLVADSNHREHTEGWPAGRTNHYWFDLNRDWLPLVHPESRARLGSFHRWKPNVLIDAHEMGTDQTYFFQPGIPSRQNPLTPDRNYELTRDIASYHAEALDAIGSLYFTEEAFDDYYYGKGSTYPDVNGAIGILFEQGSARGHVQESINGDVTFPFAIRNQFTTTLSTLRASLAKRGELLDYQAEFYRGGLEMAAADDLQGYVFGDPHDPVRVHLFLDLLRRHSIEVHALAAVVERDGTRFEPGWAYVVPLAQAQYRLIKAMFERRMSFADSAFYDVSTWTLPLAYDLLFAELNRGGFSKASSLKALLGEAVVDTSPPPGRLQASEKTVMAKTVMAKTVAYIFEWDGYLAPRALYRLLEAEVRCRVATEPFQAITSEGPRDFGYGAIVVPLGIQDVDRARVEELLGEAARLDSVDVRAITTGLTPVGIDIGSPSLRPVDLPKIALVVGPGVSGYEAGQMWHLIDQRFEMPLVLIESTRLRRVDLEKYTHLIFPGGGYRQIPSEVTDRLSRWVGRGGVLLASQGGATWINEKLVDKNRRDEDSPEVKREGGSKNGGSDEKPVRLPYAEHRSRFAVELISGSIFAVDVDITHPLAYGYRRPTLPVFRNSRTFLEADSNPYVTVAQYTDEPLLSGYVSGDNLAKIRQSPAVLAQRMGSGLIVRMVDDPNFRGFWHGTHKLVMNTLFFGRVVDNTPEP